MKNNLELMIKKFLRVVPLHRIINDKSYIKLYYYIRTGEKLNLKNPQTFNEKIQWLKLNDRKDIYTTMVDKYEAKKYVAGIIGKEYIIPTLGVYDKFDEIDFDKLPNQFVIKCTHDSGGLIIVRDKAMFDRGAAKERIEGSLKENYYYSGREWPYKNVKPRIIIEKYMEDKNNKIMRDYKFFCFDGEPEILYISDGSHSEDQKIVFFDINYNVLPIKRADYGDFDTIPKRPKNFEKMKKFSSELAKNIPHLRVDWYEINGKLYFGELTFFTGGGVIPFEDKKWDRRLGDMIDLDKVREDKD